jgi:hypothetical protein
LVQIFSSAPCSQTPSVYVPWLMQRVVRKSLDWNMNLYRMPSSGLLHCMSLVRTDVPPKCQFLQEPHYITNQKTAFFTVTVVKTSNLTWTYTVVTLRGFSLSSGWCLVSDADRRHSEFDSTCVTVTDSLWTMNVCHIQCSH